MDSRARTIAFAILLLGLSSLVVIQTSFVSSREEQNAIYEPMGNWAPLQNSNSTASSGSMTSNSTSSSANMTATSGTSSSSNSTSSGTLSQSNSTSQSPTSNQNQTEAMSSLQFQITSMNEELVAMSSSVSAMNQQTGMNTLIGEAGLIIGILAVIAAIATARRADALYKAGKAGQPTSNAPPK